MSKWSDHYSFRSFLVLSFRLAWITLIIWLLFQLDRLNKYHWKPYYSSRIGRREVNRETACCSMIWATTSRWQLTSWRNICGSATSLWSNEEGWPRRADLQYYFVPKPLLCTPIIHQKADVARESWVASCLPPAFVLSWAQWAALCRV